MSKPLVTIITAHAGNSLVGDCLDSVAQQTYDNVQHLVIVDNSDKEDCANYNSLLELIDDMGSLDYIVQPDIIQLPYSIGKDRWNGHRIYAAGTYIAKGDYVIFLDDDNYLEPNHIEECMKVIEAGNDWAYSFRNIVDKEHKFLCQDNCESLGKWASVLHPEDYFIDVNNYFLPKLLAVAISPIWYRKFREPGQPEIDRVICHALRQIAPKFDSTYQYSVNYTVGNTGLSVQKEFFEKGNAEMLKRFNGDLPWVKK